MRESQGESLRESLRVKALQEIEKEREKWQAEKEKMKDEFQKKNEEMNRETQMERSEKQKQEEFFEKSAQDWIEEKERMVREFQEKGSMYSVKDFKAPPSREPAYKACGDDERYDRSFPLQQFFRLLKLLSADCRIRAGERCEFRLN